MKIHVKLNLYLIYSFIFVSNIILYKQKLRSKLRKKDFEKLNMIFNMGGRKHKLISSYAHHINLLVSNHRKEKEK